MASDPSLLLAGCRRVHLVGIGGTGMSALASMLLDRGMVVSGSDLVDGPAIRALVARGARVAIGHAEEHLGDAELLVRSSAIGEENPEVAAARRRGLPVLRHSAALGALMAGKVGIAVAGTHGKTTTTAMVANVLAAGGLDPTFEAGSELLDFGVAGRLGRGPHVVVEADEYDRRFLDLQPRLAIVTSIEPDHLDYFTGLEDLLAAFRSFVELLPPDGLLVACADDPRVAALAVDRPRVTYGFAPGADWRLTDYRPLPNGCTFTVATPDGRERSLSLSLFGRHNAANAVAAAVVATHAGLPWEVVAAGLARFRGTRRRFELVGEAGGVRVFDDYAHHPTAVRATLRAAREAHPGPIWVAFQPHTTNRTAELLDEFAAAFEDADHVLVLPIYRPAGRERAARPVTSHDLLARMRHPDARAVADLEAGAVLLAREARAGDLVMAMGAGDVWRLARLLLARRSEGGLATVPVAERLVGRGAKRDVPLAPCTSLRVGGPADFFAEARQREEIVAWLELARQTGTPVLLLGGGSNLVVADEGVEGLALRVLTPGFRIVTEGDGATLVAEAGASLAGLARRVSQLGWGGLEWAVNVPGTIGGAIVNNAGAFGSSIAERLLRAHLVDSAGRVFVLERDDLGYAYRTSRLKRHELGTVAVLAGEFRLERRPIEELRARIAAHQARRTATQPRQHSVGSVFANPPGDYAGRLIDAAGLRGVRAGGAQISPQHANFVVNLGGARASDVVQLVLLAQDTVWRRTGVWLQPEVEFVGRWAPGLLARLRAPGGS